ncbi:MAG: acyl-ACP--UDP-N-acetylglucosamine O-acyltransferase [Candidatus Omnitrophica bacterium]|nr:acyl-ACP--UDP-N-acetylglucosamine O-acyltransferase [Candidatus Omnitrophota bacterium]
MSEIHPTAIIGKDVQLEIGNQIGPHAVIEDGVKMGSHNVIHAGAYLCRGTEIGSHNEIHMGAVIGHRPQDLAYRDAPSYTRIGDHNQIREYVTIHRGTKPESATVIGDENYLMAYCHVAHNCEIGNKVIMVNQASLSGYCKVEDQAFLSGMTGFHQFTKIGRLALVSALSASNKDVPPFMIAGGRPAVVLGINVVGLRRAGIAEPARSEIKKAYKLLYRSRLTVPSALKKIKAECGSREVQHLVSFIESSERGILAGGEEIEDGELLLSRKKPGRMRR